MSGLMPGRNSGHLEFESQLLQMMETWDGAESSFIMPP